MSGDGGKGPAETLAGASTRDLETLLGRQNRKRGRTRHDANGLLVQVPKAQLPPPPAAQAAGACGAPAAAGRAMQEQQEQQQQQQAAPGPAGLANGKTTCVQLPSIPVEDFVQLATSSDASDWEDVGDAGQRQQELGGELPLLEPASAVDGHGDGHGEDLTIVLHQQHQRAVLRRGRSFTKADRERAALVHRCHLLCLLGRGLLLDAAAGQPLLQAVLLSLVPPDVADHLRQGLEQHQRALDPVVCWFKASFRLAISSPGAGSSNEGLECGQGDIDEALLKARGIDGLVEHLQQAVERRCGTAEELSALFVAILRAHGFVVRLVRSLHPIPLRPADAQRQVEQSQLQLARSYSHAQRFVEPADAAAASAAGEPSAAAAAGRQAVSPASPAGGQTRTLSARRGSGTGRGVGPGRGRGRGRGAVDGGEDNAAGGAQAAGAMAGRGPKRRKPSAKATEDEAGQDGEGPAASLEQPKKRRRAPARGEAGTVNGAARRSSGDAAVQEHVVGLEAGAAGGVAAGAAAGAQQLQRKRKCDEEEEQQIALALAATAFDASSVGQAEAGPARATGRSRTVEGRPAAGDAVKRSAVALPRMQSQATGAGAAYSSRVSEVGSCWAEVLCGPADKARWVHVDPLTGWIDREGDVESLAPRGQPLTYVVAFAGGGAKDVTSRYSRSLLAAEKLRDSKWWEATLRPLRAKEVAVTITAAAEAGGHSLSDVPVPAVSDKQEQQQQKQQERPQEQQQQLQEKQEGLGHQDGEKMKTSHEAHRLAAAREDADLAQRAQQAKRGLPTTIDGFKSHPVYVLERHIAKYQALRPEAKKCGLHRGESYYLREDLAELHTAERWRREGREVEPSQLGQPAKRIKKRAQGKKPLGPASIDEPPAAAAAADDEDGDDDKADEEVLEGGPAQKRAEADKGALTCLYGLWQTKPWAPPAAAGGRVPRNERGNVEAPPFAAALPVGTVHLRLPFIAPVCRKLQVDFAPALVGFDARGGRMVPRLDGVVICQEFESLVLTTYLKEERQREERARQKREEEAEAAWRQLLRALLTRVRLQQDYGQGAPDGSVMGEAAAQLLRGNRGQDVGGGGRGGRAKARKEAFPVVDLTLDEAEQPQQQEQQEQGGGRGSGRGAMDASAASVASAGGLVAGGEIEGLDYEEI